MVLTEFLEAYTLARSLSLAPRTVEAERRFISMIAAAPIGSIALEQLRPADIVGFLSPIYAVHQRTAQMIYVYLLTASGTDPRLSAAMQGVTKPRHNAAPINPFSADELSRLINGTSSPAWRCCWILAGVYGLRRGELCGLRWADVDLDHNIIHINVQRQYIGGVLRETPLKSRASRRDLPVIDILSDALAALLPTSERYVVPYAPMTIYHELQKRCASLGLRRISLHSLRHTCASIAVENNQNLHLVQLMLGHASESTTARIYTHVSTASLCSPLSCIKKHLTLNQGVQGSSP